MEQSLQGLTALSVATQSKAIPVMQRYTLAAEEATATMRELEEINSQTPHTLDQTNKIYKSMYVSMKNVGATTSQMVELTRSLSIASGAAGIEFNSLLAGVDGLATGTVLANSDLGRFLSSLGLTNKALKETDDVVGLLTSSLEDFKAADTMAVATSNLSNAWSKFAGNLTATPFEWAKDGINGLAGSIEDLNRYLEFNEQAYSNAIKEQEAYYEYVRSGQKKKDDIASATADANEAKRVQDLSQLRYEAAIAIGVEADTLSKLDRKQLEYALTYAKTTQGMAERDRLAKIQEEQDLALYETQSVLNNAVLENTNVTIQNNVAKEQAIIATKELAAAEAAYYTEASWRNSDGTLKDSGGNDTYTVYSSSGGNEINLFNKTLSQSNPVLATFNNNIEEAAQDFSSLNQVLGSLESGLQSIVSGLSTNYLSSARSSLFGGTSNDISFAQAKASAQEAWDIFKTDTFNQEYLDTYNSKMNELIGTLDEFSDSSRYDSKAQQEFDKHLALRQIEGFQDAQVDTKDEVNSQLEVLKKIQAATEGSKGELESQTTLSDLIKNAISDGNITAEEMKAIEDASGNKLTGIDNKTVKNATTTRSQWVKLKDKILYDTQLVGGYTNSITGEYVPQTLESKPYAVGGEYGYRSGVGQDIGYQAGGYTGNGGVSQVAGVVHGQEFVVNAQATKDLGLNGSNGVFQQMNTKLDMLAHLYEINKTTKRSLSTERQILDSLLEVSA